MRRRSQQLIKTFDVISICKIKMFPCHFPFKNHKNLMQNKLNKEFVKIYNYDNGCLVHFFLISVQMKAAIIIAINTMANMMATSPLTAGLSTKYP